MQTFQRQTWMLFFPAIALFLSACGSGSDIGANGGSSTDSFVGSSGPLIAQKLAGTWKLYNTYCGVVKTDDGTGNVYLELSDTQVIEYGPQGCASAQVPIDYYSVTYADTGSSSTQKNGTVTMTQTRTLSTFCPSTYTTVANGTPTTYSAVTYTNDPSTMQLTGAACGGGHFYVTTYIKQ